MLRAEEIDTFITRAKSSPLRNQAMTGQAYYDAHHDIENYRVMYMSSDGEWREDKNRSNVKISHAFFTELVDQQVNYMLSSDEIVRAKSDELQKELESYFDDDFYAELREVVTGTVVKGHDYMYAYRGEDGILKFEHADSLHVVEVKAKDNLDATDYVIYWYDESILVDGSPITVTRIQVWDEEQVAFFVRRGAGAEITKDRSYSVNPQPHVVEVDELGARYRSEFQIGRIPFFRLDNNEKKRSGLEPVKSLIDDYDLMACGLSNNITDAVEAITVVKGFDGEDLGEMIENMRAKKYVGIPADDNTESGSNVDFKTVDIPVEARRVKLEQDEKNIYRFGMGFNVSELTSGGNVTNVMIKSRYALLDLKCNKLEIRLKRFLRSILKVILNEINARKGTSYSTSDVKLVFEREIMSNALDNATIEQTQAATTHQRIQTLLDVAARIGDEQVLRGIADALDLDYDDVRRREVDPIRLLEDDYSALDSLEVAEGEVDESA